MSELKLNVLRKCFIHILGDGDGLNKKRVLRFIGITQSVEFVRTAHCHWGHRTVTKYTQ